jgi:phytoene dehydrogenase-like protein
MGVSRRDFVAMLLGAPIAAQLACRGRRRSLPPGRLIETGMTRGHALIRDGALPKPARTRETGVAIIGGGVAGLACAWELKRRGVASTILELDDVIGGTARGGGAGPGEVTPYPWGAHYIVAPQSNDDAIVPLLAEMNAIEGYAADGSPIIDEALRCREPEERVWYAGRWWEGLYLDAGANADDRRQLDAFKKLIDGWAAWRDDRGRRAFAIPRSAATDDPRVTALDQISLAQWLDDHGLHSPRLRWLCDYGCRDDYALTASATSAWAGIFYFAARQKAPGGVSQEVITWPNGNAALVAQLAKSATIETGVTAVDVDGNTITAIDRDGPIAIHARAIVVATPTFVANRIVKARRGQPSGDYGAWVVANVHLRERPIERGRGCPPAWDNVFRDSPSLGYVSATHQRGRDRGPTVWTWYYAFADDDAASVRKQLAGAGYAEWAETILVDLERAHPDVRDRVETIDVAFWGHGMIRPRVGSAWNPALVARRAQSGNVHFAHTDLSGIALFEEAFDHGLRAAREVIA